LFCDRLDALVVVGLIQNVALNLSFVREIHEAIREIGKGAQAGKVAKREISKECDLLNTHLLTIQARFARWFDADWSVLNLQESVSGVLTATQDSTTG
jgi:hypothetical protein